MAGIGIWWPMGPEHGRVGLIVVSPNHQRQGLGRTLMERILEDAKGRSLTLLATEEGRPLYEKLGFRTVERTQRHVGQYRLPGTGAPGVEDFSPADLAAVLSIDRLGFGPDREPMVRHLLATGTARVTRDGKDIVGYAISRPFGRGNVIGPIVAVSEAHALTLFKAVADPGYIRVDRPLQADGLGSLIEAEGLEGQEITHAMARGDWPPARDGFGVFALASHAWG